MGLGTMFYGKGPWSGVLSAEYCGAWPPLLLVQMGQLWRRDMQLAKITLGQYRSLVRGTVTQFRGYEVKERGHAFMLAFTAASDAVLFFKELQSLLQTQSWMVECDVLQDVDADPGDGESTQVSPPCGPFHWD